MIHVPLRKATKEDFNDRGHYLMDRIFYIEGNPGEYHGPFTMRDMDPDKTRKFFVAGRVYVPWVSLAEPGAYPEPEAKK